MERKKWGTREGGEEIVYAGRNTAKQFLYNHVFSFPRKESSKGEGSKGGGTAENLHAREFSSVCWWRVSARKKKEKEKKKTDELPLANRSLLRLFPLIGNYSISSVWKLIDALYETRRARVQLGQREKESERGGSAIDFAVVNDN